MNRVGNRCPGERKKTGRGKLRVTEESIDVKESPVRIVILGCHILPTSSPRNFWEMCLSNDFLKYTLQGVEDLEE